MYDWKAVILKPEDTMEKAIQVLNKESLRIVLVADEYGRLLGTVTDGDIRRALIRRQEMNSFLADIMFKKPIVATLEDDRNKILAMMKARDLLQVPVLDDDRKIIGLETLQHILEKGKKLDNPIFLMAGGFGKRLRPLTNDIPKPLLKIGNKPILETIVNQFVDAGFHKFFISTHYKAEMVRTHFGDGSNWDVNIQYVHEEEPLGTAGALGLLPELNGLPIIMMNGDILTKIKYDDLLEFHNRNKSDVSVCVREYDFQVPFGIVEVDENIVEHIVEKPVHKFFVNAGIYVIEPSVIKTIEKNSYKDMPDLINELSDNSNKISAFPVHEYWLDIGRIDDFDRAQHDFNSQFE